MGWERLAQVAIEALFVLGAMAILVGAALGQPVLLGFVETGSMEPTLSASDGFVAVPAAVAGPIQEGDVVVFRAEEVNDGQLTTHRVVKETNRGYVTKGDANPFTDQDGGEPPVQRAQIVAEALQVNGHVVVIPHLGTVVEGTQTVLSAIQRRLAVLFGTRSLLGVQGLAYLFFASTLLWYAIGWVRDRNTNQRDSKQTRDRTRNTGTDARFYVAIFAAILVLAATAAMVVPAGTQKYGIVSAEFESERPDVIPVGESKDLNYTLTNGGLVPTHVYLEPASEGVEIEPDHVYLGGRSSVNATLTLHAPPQTGYYRRFVTERRYLALLPAPVIQSLYSVHPWAPIVVIDALIGVPFYLVGVALAGGGRLRDRSRDRDRSLTARLRRAVMGRY